MANPTLRGARKMAPWQRAIVAALIVSLAAFASTTFTAFAAATTVSSLDTTSGPTAGGTSVTIVGTGFMTGGSGSTAATAVTFGGTAATFTVTDDTHIAATSPAHAASAVPVVVSNVDGASNATVMYTYVAPVPTVTAVSPIHGAAAGGDTVTITGTGLSFATSVHFGAGVGSIVTNSDTSITATTPAHAAGQVDVDVTTAGGTSAHTAADLFTFDALPLPTVSSVSPSSGPTTGGTTVTVTGTNLIGATSVTFSGAAGASIVVNGAGTSLTVTSPVHGAGTTDVQVTTPAGPSAVNANDKFTFGSGPTVTAVFPASGGTAGGTLVTVTGTAFTGATAVTFGGIAATFNLVNDTTISATTPAHAAGVVDVAVTTSLGTSANTAADDFVYTSAPIVTAISPTSGPTGGGTVVTVTGENLTGATSVSFGGVLATPSNITATSLTVTSPAAAAAGTVDVLVTTPSGTSANTTADDFTYGSLPTVTSISPTTGPVGGGTTVTVTGTGFTGATAVNLDGTMITPSNVTATSLTFVTPAHAAGVVGITVTTPLGTSADTAADDFTFGASTITYTLYFRFSLIVWEGVDGISIDAALKGQETPDNPATNDISGSVTAIYRYNNPAQKFEAWFPNSANIPGANDFSVLNNGTAYWIAESTNPSITWTVAGG